LGVPGTSFPPTILTEGAKRGTRDSSRDETRAEGEHLEERGAPAEG